MTAAATQGIATRGYAFKSKDAKAEPFEFARREVGPKDILIDILYAGICHSDIHTVRGEWGTVPYPLTVGHEIVGRVAQVGAEVSPRFRSALQRALKKRWATTMKIVSARKWCSSPTRSTSRSGWAISKIRAWWRGA